MRKLRSRYDDSQRRLDTAFEDRLDGIIDDRYWAEIPSKWHSGHDHNEQRIARFKDVNSDYVDTGVRIIEVAQKVHSLYVSQSAEERRMLLDTLLSNCALDGVTLYPTYRRPFDLIAEGVKTQQMLPELSRTQNL